MLKIDNLVVAYGGIEALKGISLEVEEGKIVTLIGANGAGKSTTLRTVMGLVKPKQGMITYMGKNLLNMKTQEMVRQGITLVPREEESFQIFRCLRTLKSEHLLEMTKRE